MEPAQTVKPCGACAAGHHDWRNPPPPPAPEITPEIEAALIAAGWAPPA